MEVEGRFSPFSETQFLSPGETRVGGLRSLRTVLRIRFRVCGFNLEWLYCTWGELGVWELGLYPKEPIRSPTQIPGQGEEEGRSMEWVLGHQRGWWQISWTPFYYLLLNIWTFSVLSELKLKACLKNPTDSECRTFCRAHMECKLDHYCCRASCGNVCIHMDVKGRLRKVLFLLHQVHEAFGLSYHGETDSSFHIQPNLGTLPLHGGPAAPTLHPQAWLV